jgi:molybdate transport system substrate-binding protein
MLKISGPRCVRLLGLVATALLSCAALADDAQIAVATNFAAPAKQLADQFSERTGHRLVLSSGSTGKFYAQVKNGAPFDALLSADGETPLKMEAKRLAVSGTRFTYAIGRLVLWSPQQGLVDDKASILRTRAFNRIAIANPRLAPYGAAAKQTMEKLGVWQALQDKLVQGENIAQSFQFVFTRNADLGFIALSQLRERSEGQAAGSHWLVPAELHAPLRQDAVLLDRGASNAAARGFLDYLRSPPARELIRAYGYELDSL